MPTKNHVVTPLTVVLVLVIYQMLAPRVGLPII